MAMTTHLDTNNLHVEWLGAEDTKQEVRGSSAGGRKAKNHLIYDLRHTTVWLSSEASPRIKIFSLFFGFTENHITIGFYNR
jgi:hypothetical protein